MTSRRRELLISDLSDFVGLFRPGGELDTDRKLWFRGEGKRRKKGALLPSLAREHRSGSSEWALYQRFRQNAAAFLPHTSLSAWDWMFYMRHYGVATRLLDWSESALVALYFAVEKQTHDTREGVVWCLDPLRLNERANVGRAVQCAGLDKGLEAYTVESVKDSPEDVEYQPVAFIAPRSFSRLVAQQGVFTVIHRAPVALDAIDDSELLVRIRVPARSKRRIRSTLHAVGMSRLSLYPELQSLAGEVIQ